MSSNGWKLVVHGGAGIIEKQGMEPGQEDSIRASLEQALEIGSAILTAGGNALDAVDAAVRKLEDDPNFNAGRGAVFTFDGRNELDAAIMDGRDRSAGAVAGVTTTRHPVALARAVMEKSPHVLLRGEGADQFAREQSLEQVENSWFATDERRRQLDLMKEGTGSAFDVDLKYGTVGAVALDCDGHVAAATSTGGLTGKRWGRVGDTPVIGAGTYADDRSAAVSATGSGEYFMRTLAAYQVAQNVRDGATLTKALQDALADVRSMGGSGGLIAVTPDGQATWSFTTPGMYRGVAGSGGFKVALYSDAEER